MDPALVRLQESMSHLTPENAFYVISDYLKAAEDLSGVQVAATAHQLAKAIAVHYERYGDVYPMVHEKLLEMALLAGAESDPLGTGIKAGAVLCDLSSCLDNLRACNPDEIMLIGGGYPVCLTKDAHKVLSSLGRKNLQNIHDNMDTHELDLYVIKSHSANGQGEAPTENKMAATDYPEINRRAFSTVWYLFDQNDKFCGLWGTNIDGDTQEESLYVGAALLPHHKGGRIHLLKEEDRKTWTNLQKVIDKYALKVLVPCVPWSPYSPNSPIYERFRVITRL